MRASLLSPSQWHSLSHIPLGHLLLNEMVSEKYLKPTVPPALMLCFLGFTHRSRASGGETRKQVCFSLKDTWTQKDEGEPTVPALYGCFLE